MCTILINQPTVTVSGTTITSITVTGSIGPIGQCACDVVQVSLECVHAAISIPKDAFINWVSGNGTFTVTFSGSEIPAGCECNKSITVRVKCDSITETTTFQINCDTIDPCKDLNVTFPAGPICENTPFQFQVAYTGGGSVNLNVDFLDGSSPINIGNVGGSPVTVSHTYTTAGNKTIKIYNSNLECKFSVKIEKCDCCPNANADITSTVKEACNKDQTKTVKIKTQITPTPKPNCPTTIQAEMYVDGILVDSGSGSSPFSLTHGGDYDCGTHQVVIKYPNSDCPDDVGTFCVSVCETAKCKSRRFSFEVATTTAVIFLVLYLFNSAYTILLTSGIITAVVALIIYFFLWRPCDKKCARCPWFLAVWQIWLASFLGFIMLSKSSFIFIYAFLVAALAFTGPLAPILAIIIIVIVILLIILIIYLFYMRWVNRCCPTECEIWTNIKEAMLDVCAISFGIVAGVILTFGGAALAILFWIPYATIIWAILIWLVSIRKIKACI